MKDSELIFDRKCHILYTKKCKEQILKRIATHYPKEDTEKIFTSVQKQYVAYLNNFRTNLGGKANFHNGIGSTYDCIAMFSYYTVCKEKTSFHEIEEMYENVFVSAFKKMRFVNANIPLFRRIMYLAFVSANKKCDKWNDYIMHVFPYKRDEPIRYEFTACPVAEFAKENNLLDILPALCNADYAAMELIHAKLIRAATCGNGKKCDYTICGDKDAYVSLHEEYIDDEGYRRNR